MNTEEKVVIAKANFIIGKALVTVIALTSLFDLPRGILVGLLIVIASILLTSSTVVWMSR